MKTVLCLLLCWVSTVLFADTTHLNALLKKYHSLQANFSEVIVNKQGDRTMTTGKVFIQKPNQFRWEAVSPNPQLFISNGLTVWNVEPELNQATFMTLQHNVATTPLLLLSGDVKDINQVFRIVQINSTNYDLTPRDGNAMIKKVLLGFNANGIVNFLQIDNTLGQSSRIHLSKIKVNQPLPQSLFTYKPAKGMSVLDQTAVGAAGS